MTNAELQEKLKLLPPELDVFTHNEGHIRNKEIFFIKVETDEDSLYYNSIIFYLK